MSVTRPLDWIDAVETSLIELDTKPQFSLPAPFNWKLFEQEVQQLIGCQECKFVHAAQGWRSSHELFSILSAEELSLSIQWAPLEEPAFFVTESQSLKEVMSLCFQSEEATNFFYDSSYVNGFYTYFAAELLRLIESQSFASPLTARLASTSVNLRELLGKQSCFVIDVGLIFKGKTVWGKILLSESFHAAWKRYFAHLKPPSLSKEMKAKLQVEVNVEVSHTQLSLEEWKKVRVGDCVLLDHCSYDPQEREGAAILTLNQKPIFRGRIKNEGIKITNYPIYEEVSDMMEEPPFKKNFNEDDEDLYKDLDDDEDEFEEDEDLFADLEPRKEPEEPAEPVKEAEAEQVEAASAEKSSFILPDELPIRLTVEVGRILINAGDLMKLAPGNLLELNVTPEQGVDLVISGKKVGRGELIRMGDLLGIRILSI